LEESAGRLAEEVGAVLEESAGRLAEEAGAALEESTGRLAEEAGAVSASNSANKSLTCAKASRLKRKTKSISKRYTIM